MRVEFSPLTAGQKHGFRGSPGARVARAGLRNGTIPTLDLEVLDYYVCVSDSLRMVCLSRSGQSHRSSSQSHSGVTETLLGPEIILHSLCVFFFFFTLFVLIHAKRL